jgi:glycosyltransferase involved in cell wall biosynthesis
MKNLIRISVITPSLNHARFLRETIESIRSQKISIYEHIVIDGGSTDGTLEILNDYPNIIWISEPDNSIVEAYQKGFSRARGEYIVQCCVSDGFIDPNWFKIGIEFLDKNPDVALVWGLPQYMTEDGALGAVSYSELLYALPPSTPEGFFAFWQTTHFCFPEGNYIVRSEIIRNLFPNDNSISHYQIQPHLGFMYEFMRNGYISYFFPRVVNYGRIHKDQRGKRLSAIEVPARKKYIQDIKSLRKYNNYKFRGRNNQIINEISWKISIFLWPPFIYQLIIRSKFFINSPLKIFTILKLEKFKRSKK